jgi:hypothetical protein
MTGDFDPGLANDPPAPWREGDDERDGAFSLASTRSIEALRQKARRGELLLTVAVTYVKANDGRIEKDPDLRVKDGIALVFRKFGANGPPGSDPVSATIRALCSAGQPTGWLKAQCLTYVQPLSIRVGQPAITTHRRRGGQKIAYDRRRIIRPDWLAAVRLKATEPECRRWRSCRK